MSVRRITVLQEAARRGQALDLVADVAAALQAELLCLFVEDIDLLHFAALPFAREIGVSSATSRGFDVETMERSLRSKAEEARRAFAAAAGAATVRWTFRVARGSVPEQLRAALADADLVVLTTLGAEPRTRPGLAAALSSAILPSIVAPVLGRLSRALAGDFDVLLVGADSEAARKWEEETRAMLAEGDFAERLRILPVAGEEELAQALRKLRRPVSRLR